MNNNWNNLPSYTKDTTPIENFKNQINQLQLCKRVNNPRPCVQSSLAKLSQNQKNLLRLTPSECFALTLATPWQI